MGTEILAIKNLKKQYPGKFSLDIKNLCVADNRILVLIGPNGSGKSTLIKLINLLESPDSGSIIFDGSEILDPDAKKVEIRKKMAVVFQDQLLFSMSVQSNILLGLNLRKMHTGSKKQLFDYLVDKLNLKALLNRNPKSLSGGEQQRVALARALILEPKLLLLDEPLANIDQVSREELRRELFDILKSIGRSTIYVTHDRNEAMIIADGIAVINEGRIEQQGNKNDVFRKPESSFVAKFVGVETLVEGTVLEQKNNVCRVLISPNRNGSILSVVAPDDVKTGDKVMLAIRPEDVTLFSSQIQPDILSALNSLEGIITEIEDIGIFKKVEIDCGFKLVSFVTLSSIERMGLRNGLKVLCTIKASSIHLFKTGTSE